jgi:Uma2 family endonuclease
MSPTPSPARAGAVVYPDSDGKPMADNTRQARWIATLWGNLTILFTDAADVFVAMDLLWYAQEGQPDVRVAPDVMVVFGRPRGERGTYRQWQEDDIPVTVAFEVLSPSNTDREMADKRAFYEEHGVEEYYVYDPDRNTLEAYRRKGAVLRRVRGKNLGSPRLDIRFDLSGPEMVVFYPDGRPFLTHEELGAELARAEQRAEHAEQRARRMAELTRKALQGQATAEERQELERLLEQPVRR